MPPPKGLPEQTFQRITIPKEIAILLEEDERHVRVAVAVLSAVALLLKVERAVGAVPPVVVADRVGGRLIDHVLTGAVLLDELLVGLVVSKEGVLYVAVRVNGVREVGPRCGVLQLPCLCACVCIWC